MAWRSITVVLATELLSCAAQDIVIQRKLSAGDSHACVASSALTGFDQVLCWGDGSDLKTLSYSGSYVDVSCGRDFNCAISANGALDCWGKADIRPPGGTIADEVDLGQGRPGEYSTVSCGQNHGCAIEYDTGNSVCWGLLEDRAQANTTGNFVQAATGSEYTLLVDASTGDLDASVGPYDWLVPPYKVLSVSTSHDVACGIEWGTLDIRCWGNTSDHHPAHIDGDFFDLDASGSTHLCALEVATGNARCWGTVGGKAAPERIYGKYTEVASGLEFFCLIDDTPDQLIGCFGDDNDAAVTPASLHTNFGAYSLDDALVTPAPGPVQINPIPGSGSALGDASGPISIAGLIAMPTDSEQDEDEHLLLVSSTLGAEVRMVTHDKEEHAPDGVLRDIETAPKMLASSPSIEHGSCFAPLGDVDGDGATIEVLVGEYYKDTINGGIRIDSIQVTSQGAYDRIASTDLRPAGLDAWPETFGASCAHLGPAVGTNAPVIVAVGAPEEDIFNGHVYIVSMQVPHAGVTSADGSVTSANVLGWIEDPEGAIGGLFGASVANLGLVQTTSAGAAVSMQSDAAVEVELAVGAPLWYDDNDTEDTSTAGGLFVLRAHLPTSALGAPTKLTVSSYVVVSPYRQPSAFSALQDAQFSSAEIGTSVALVGFHNADKQTVLLVGAPGVNSGQGAVFEVSVSSDHAAVDVRQVIAGATGAQFNGSTSFPLDCQFGASLHTVASTSLGLGEQSVAAVAGFRGSDDETLQCPAGTADRLWFWTVNSTDLSSTAGWVDAAAAGPDPRDCMTSGTRHTCHNALVTSSGVADAVAVTSGAVASCQAATEFRSGTLHPDSLVYSVARAGCETTGAGTEGSAGSNPGAATSQHGGIAWVGPALPCSAAVVPGARGLDVIEAGSEIGSCEAAAGNGSSYAGAIRIVLRRQSSSEHSKWSSGAPRPSELHRAQEKAQVWVGGLRCPVVSFQRGATEDHVMCIPSTLLAPGLAHVSVRLSYGYFSGSDASETSAVAAAANIGQGMPPCEAALRSLTGEALAPPVDAAVPCVAIGFAGPMQLSLSVTAAAGDRFTRVLTSGPGLQLYGRLVHEYDQSVAASSSSTEPEGAIPGEDDLPWAAGEALVTRELQSQRQVLGLSIGHGVAGTIDMPDGTGSAVAEGRAAGGPYSMYAVLPGLSGRLSARLYATTDGNATVQWVSYPEPDLQVAAPSLVELPEMLLGLGDPSLVKHFAFEGNHFGPSDLVTTVPDALPLPSVTVGDAPCGNLTIVSSTRLTCSSRPNLMRNGDVVLSMPVGRVPDWEASGWELVLQDWNVTSAAAAQAAIVSALEWQYGDDAGYGEPLHVTAAIIDAFEPVVVASQPRVISPTGGEQVQLLGIDVGTRMSDYLVGVTIDGINCTGVTRESDLSILCVAGGGSGGPGSVALETVFGWTSQGPDGVVQYSPPVVTSLVTSPTAVFNAREVKYNVTVTGRHFGVPVVGLASEGSSAVVSASMGGVACPRVVVDSDTQLQCIGVQPPWVTGNFDAVVTLGTNTGTGAGLFQYQPPVVVSAASPSVVVAGEVLTITGAGLGSQATIESVTVGPYPCVLVAVSAAGDEIQCRAMGVGSGHKVSVTVQQNGFNDPSTAPTVAFAAPSIAYASIVQTSLSSSSSSTSSAGASGDAGLPRPFLFIDEPSAVLSLDIVNAGWELSQWDPTHTPSGALVTLDAGSAKIPCTGLVRTDSRPALASGALPAQNNSIIRVNCTVDWTAADPAIGSTEPGVTIAATVQLSVGGQAGIGSLAQADIEAVQSSQQVPQGGGIVLVGRPSVLLALPNSFPTSGSAAAAVSNAARLAQLRSNVTATPLQQLEALVDLAVQESGQAGSVTSRLLGGAADLGRQLQTATSSNTSSVLSASDPRVQAAAPTLLAESFDAGLLVIQGSNFGSGPWAVRAVKLGEVVSRVVVWVSPGELLAYCEPGVGSGVVTSVETFGGVSVSAGTNDIRAIAGASITYDRPLVDFVTPASAIVGPLLVESFRLTGQHFGFSQSDVESVSVGGYPCDSFAWVSPSQIDCFNASGASWPGGRNVEVTVAGYTSRSNRAFEPLGEPLVTGVSPSSGIAGSRILVSGENFGDFSGDVTSVRLGSTECLGVTHISRTAVECVVPDLAGAAQDAELAVTITTRAGVTSAETTDTPTFEFAQGIDPPAHVPESLMAWRDAADTIVVRWAYPDPISVATYSTAQTGAAAEELDGFYVEVVVAESDVAPASVSSNSTSLFVAGMTDLVAIQTGSVSNLTMYQFAIPSTSIKPVHLRVAARNQGGVGSSSTWTPPVHQWCGDNQYLSTQLGPSDWACRPCDPYVVVCDGGSSFDVASRPGFFRLPWTPGRLGFVECPRPESCISTETETELRALVMRLGGGAGQTSAQGTGGPTLEQVYGLQPAPAFLGQRRSSLIRKLVALGVVPPDYEDENLEVPEELSDLAEEPFSRQLRVYTGLTAEELVEQGMPRWVGERCAEGYEGLLCKRCSAGYTPFGAHVCRKCRTGGLVIAYAAAMILIVILATIFIGLNALKNGGQQLAKLTIEAQYEYDVARMEVFGDLYGAGAKEFRAREEHHDEMAAVLHRRAAAGGSMDQGLPPEWREQLKEILKVRESEVDKLSKKKSLVTAIKILFSHIQVVSIANSFDLRWPDAVVRMFESMEIASSAASEVFSVNCLLTESADDEAYAQLIEPYDGNATADLVPYDRGALDWVGMRAADVSNHSELLTRHEAAILDPAATVGAGQYMPLGSTYFLRTLLVQLSPFFLAFALLLFWVTIDAVDGCLYEPISDEDDEEALRDAAQKALGTEYSQEEEQEEQEQLEDDGGVVEEAGDEVAETQPGPSRTGSASADAKQTPTDPAAMPARSLPSETGPKVAASPGDSQAAQPPPARRFFSATSAGTVATSPASHGSAMSSITPIGKLRAAAMLMRKFKKQQQKQQQQRDKAMQDGPAAVSGAKPPRDLAHGPGSAAASGESAKRAQSGSIAVSRAASFASTPEEAEAAAGSRHAEVQVELASHGAASGGIDQLHESPVVAWQSSPGHAGDDTHVSHPGPGAGAAGAGVGASANYKISSSAVDVGFPPSSVAVQDGATSGGDSGTAASLHRQRSRRHRSSVFVAIARTLGLLAAAPATSGDTSASPSGNSPSGSADGDGRTPKAQLAAGRVHPAASVTSNGVQEQDGGEEEDVQHECFCLASHRRTGSVMECIGIPLIVMRLSLFTRFMSGVIVVAFLIHLTLTSAGFGLLTCRDIEPSADLSAGLPAGDLSSDVYSSASVPDTCPSGFESRRLVLDLDVCCHNTEALTFMYGLGMPSIFLFALGIPGFAGLYMYFVRQRLDDADVVATLGFFMSGFKRETFYWEVMIMLRKLAIVAITVVVEPWGVQVQTYSALAVLFASSLIHALYKPYKLTELNNLELVALCGEFITFVAGLFINDDNSGNLAKVVATMILFIANVMVFAAVIWLAWPLLTRCLAQVPFCQRVCSCCLPLPTSVRRAHLRKAKASRRLRLNEIYDDDDGDEVKAQNGDGTEQQLENPEDTSRNNATEGAQQETGNGPRGTEGDGETVGRPPRLGRAQNESA